jgi:hypothetical protein
LFGKTFSSTSSFKPQNIEQRSDLFIILRFGVLLFDLPAIVRLRRTQARRAGIRRAGCISICVVLSLSQSDPDHFLKSGNSPEHFVHGGLLQSRHIFLQGGFLQVCQ